MKSYTLLLNADANGEAINIAKPAHFESRSDALYIFSKVSNLKNINALLREKNVDECADVTVVAALIDNHGNAIAMTTFKQPALF